MQTFLGRVNNYEITCKKDRGNKRDNAGMKKRCERGFEKNENVERGKRKEQEVKEEVRGELKEQVMNISREMKELRREMRKMREEVK